MRANSPRQRCPALRQHSYFIIFTNPIAEYMSQAKPQRELNPKLVQRFPLHTAVQVTAP